MKSARTLFLILALLTILRMVLVALEKPSPQETYYFLCSAHPAAAYFDGPPGMAWTVGVFARLGHSDVLWRLPAPLWALAASIACYFLLRKRGDGSSAAYATLALNIIPAFNTSALRLSPWLPAITFLLLTLLCSRRAFDREQRSLVWAAMAGLCLGFASLFVYWSCSLAVGILLYVFCAVRKPSLRELAGIALLLLIPLAMLYPALQWNAALQWIPIAGGTLRTWLEFSLGGFGLSLVVSLYLISPLIFGGLFWSWFSDGGQSRLHLQPRFFFLAALPAMFSAIYALFRGIDAVFFLLAASPLLLGHACTLSRRLRGGPVLAGLAAAMAVLLSIHASSFALMEGRHWAPTAAKVRDAFLQKQAEGQEDLFLIAQDAPLASVLGYYFRDELIPPPGHPSVYARESQDISSQFALWPGYDDFVETPQPPNDGVFTEQKGENPFIGRNALYITRESPDDLPQSIKGAFASVDLLESLHPEGEIREPLYIYLCVNYQTLPL